jgi:hypothetical protein
LDGSIYTVGVQWSRASVPGNATRCNTDEPGSGVFGDRRPAADPCLQIHKMIANLQAIEFNRIGASMATTHAADPTPKIEVAFGQAKAVNDQWLAAWRKSANLYMESYEKVMDGAIGLELEIAHHVEPEWLRDLIKAHCNVTREIVSTYTGAAEGLLK